MGWQDGSADRSTFHQPKFNPWDPHGKKGELTLTVFTHTHTHAITSWHTCAGREGEKEADAINIFKIQILNQSCSSQQLGCLCLEFQETGNWPKVLAPELTEEEQQSSIIPLTLNYPISKSEWPHLPQLIYIIISIKHMVRDLMQKGWATVTESMKSFRTYWFTILHAVELIYVFRFILITQW